MNNLTKATIIAGVFAVLVTTGYAYTAFNSTPTASEQTATTTPQQPQVREYGNATLALGELATFKNISIRPVALLEDSRCPQDVQCIQAGTVRVSVEVASKSGTSTSILTLGKKFTTDDFAITLANVIPGKISTTQNTESEYRLTFTVLPQNTPVVTDPQGKCYVGGCSAQVCSDQPDMASTCEYRAEYACYKTAKCERQASGQCGWTPTQTLAMCLANPPQM